MNLSVQTSENRCCTLNQIADLAVDTVRLLMIQ